MRWFADLRIFWKVSIPLYVLFIVYLGIAVQNNLAFRQLTHQIHLSTHMYLPSVQLLLNADRDMYQAMEGLEGVLRYKDKKQQEEIDYYRHNSQQVFDRVSEFGKVSKAYDSEFSAKAQNILKRYQRWKSLGEEVIRLAQQGKLEQAEKLYLEDMENAFAQVRDLLDPLGVVASEKADRVSEEAVATAEEANSTVIFGGIIILGLLLITAIFLPPMVTRRLKTLQTSIEALGQGNGDLNARIELHGKDEVVFLAESFNKFIAKLHTIMSQVAMQTREVASASAKLRESSLHALKISSEQNAAVESIVTAATQMSATVADVTQNTVAAAEETEQADKHAQKGKGVTQASLSSINDLCSNVNSASANIEDLSENVAQISSILNIIQGISEQTNLLALNAAIEAARAGEHGRGFAVVADEVRSLATRTSQSTQDINNMIEKLNSGVKSSVTIMQQSTGLAENTAQHSQDMEASLSAIVDSVRLIRDMSHQISTAAEEQRVTTDDITQHITHIGDLSRENEQEATGVANASEHLQTLSKRLDDVVGQFKL